MYGGIVNRWSPITLGASLVAILACSGLPTDFDAESIQAALQAAGEGGSEAVEVKAEIEPQIAELLDAEDPDGKRDAAARAERAVELESFISATDDFDAWRPATLDRLALGGTDAEAAYSEVSSGFEAAPPLELACATKACPALVMVHHGWTTADDWARASEAVHKAFSGTDVVVTSLARGVAAANLAADGKAVRTVDVTPHLAEDHLTTGYLFLMAEGEPVWQAPADGAAVVEAAARALGVCPTTGCPEGMTEAPAPTPRPRRRAAPAPAPEPEPAPAPAPAPEPEMELPELPIEIPDLDTPDLPNKRKTRRGR
ncbi:MAG: hypothetical protein ACI9K2_002013 [Myxococcota bacterium]